MRLTRIAPIVFVAAAAVAAGSVTETRAPNPESTTNAVPAKPDDKTVTHVLNRIGFGPATGDVEDVRRIGLAKYIEQQLHPETHRRHRDGGASGRVRDADEERARARRGLFRARADGAAPGATAGGQRSVDGRQDADKKPMRTPEQIDAMQGERAGARRADAAEDAARRLQRAPARGSAGRFLVQPLQRVRRQGTDAALPAPSTSATRFVRTCSASSAICSARRRRARRCCSISTTGRAPAPDGSARGAGPDGDRRRRRQLGAARAARRRLGATSRRCRAGAGRAATAARAASTRTTPAS